jgi:hypothetical protein
MVATWGSACVEALGTLIEELDFDRAAALLETLVPDPEAPPA